jgi:uncharacterized membrane protein
MPWGHAVVEWLHVFFAIVWFGGTVFFFAVVGPALRRSDPAVALKMGPEIGRRAQLLLAPAGALTIIFGLLNAIVFGPANSLAYVSASAYGRTFITAVVLSVIIAVLGAITGRIGGSIARAPEAKQRELVAQIGTLSFVSIIGFCLVLVCMILMRYGL